MRSVIKPMTLGLLAKPYGYKGQTHFALTALAFFRLGEAPALIPEHEAWPVVSPALPAQQVLDEAMPKTRAEILLAGSAYAPDGKAVTAMTVNLQCGAVNKSLRITGDRQWRYGLLPLQQVDAPVPFVNMPLDACRSWGGKGFPANPLGCGYTESRWPAFFKSNQGVLPNISLAGEVRGPGRRRHTPAGFAPWSINHPARRKLAGSYNKRWLKEDFPGLARNIDWRFFNMAPQDQQLKGFLKGNESYCLSGLHPVHAQLRGQLPGIGARAFISTRTETFVEVSLNADTLWFFPDQNMGVLIFHGQHLIEDSEAQDVQSVMLAYERLGESRSLAHYQEVLQLRTDPATRHLHVFNEAQLTMPLIARALEVNPAADPRQLALQARLDEMEADFWAEAGIEKPADYAAPVAPELLPNPYGTDGSMDLTALMAAADQKLEQAKANAAAQEAHLHTQLTEQIANQLPAAELPVTAEEVLARANPVQQLEAELARLPLNNLSPAQQDEIVQAITGALIQARALRKLAREPISKLVTADAAIQLAGLVKLRLQQGESLAAFNLAGVILVGQSFVGSNLGEVNFERGNFSHCDFSKADLRGVSFVGAQLMHCRFQHTQLDESNWSGATVMACDFGEAHLPKSHWSKTCIQNSDFSRTEFNGATFNQAEIIASQFVAANFTHSIWLEVKARDSQWDKSTAQQLAWLGCDFKGCSFNGIEWQQGALLNCVGENHSFCEARLEKILITGEAGKSVWAGTDWRGARVQQCGFRQSQLPAANFAGAHFSNCDFGNVELMQVTAHQALFHQCILLGASAPEGQFSGADFCQSLAMKMNLTGANLQDAQIWRTHFHQAQLHSAQITNVWPAKNLELAV